MSYIIQQVNRVYSNQYLDQDGKALVRAYQIILTPSSNPADFAESDAVSATDGTTAIPPYYDLITVDGVNYILSGRRVTWDPKSAHRILVECNYKSNTEGIGSGTLPWLKDLRIEPVRFVETAYVDADGAPLVTTVGEPIDPLPQRVIRGRKYTISFLAQNFDVKPFEDAEEFINSDVVRLSFQTYRGPRYTRVFKPNTLYMDSVTVATAVYPGASSVLSVSMDLIYRSNFDAGVEYGWYYRTPNRGFFQSVGGSPKQILIGSTPAPTAQYLDSAGAYIPPGSPTKPFMLNFRLNQKTAFAPLLSKL